MSSSVPCAPSNSRLPPALLASYRLRGTSATIGLRRSAIAIMLSSVWLKLDHLGLVVVLQHEVVVVEHFAQLGGKTLAVEQVLQAQRTARHLVLVGGTDAAPGGADLAGALGDFARLIERHVVRHDERAGFAEFQAAGDVDAGGYQHVHFFQQRGRRQHHAVADVAGDVVTQDAGRDQVQHGFLAGHHQRVARVVAALETHHALRAVGQPVDDFALAFIAPLGADDDDVFCCHGEVSPYCVSEPAMTSSRKSRLKPVAGRARPNTRPTSS